MHATDFTVILMVSCPFMPTPEPSHLPCFLALHLYTTFGMASVGAIAIASALGAAFSPRRSNEGIY